MPSEVVIESAGSHVFDLGHLRRQGGEELVQIALRLAGYDRSLWRVRVEKKVTCNSETKPLTVVGWKPWCCYLKIKPGDNNSCHYCSLLMPDGYRGADVYAEMKRVEPMLDRNWRNVAWEKVVDMSEPATIAADEAAELDEAAPPAEVTADADTPAAAPPADETTTDDGAPDRDEGPSARDADGEAGKTDTRGWTKDPERVRLVLLAINEVDKAGPHIDQADFVVKLTDKLDWKGLNRYEIGGVFTSLVRAGFIISVRRGGRASGYTLTEDGHRYMADLLPPGS